MGVERELARIEIAREEVVRATAALSAAARTTEAGARPGEEDLSIYGRGGPAEGGTDDEGEVMAGGVMAPPPQTPAVDPPLPLTLGGEAAALSQPGLS